MPQAKSQDKDYFSQRVNEDGRCLPCPTQIRLETSYADLFAFAYAIYCLIIPIFQALVFFISSLLTEKSVSDSVSVSDGFSSANALP